MVETIVHQVLSGSRRALARTLSIIENDGDVAPDLLIALHQHDKHSFRIGITGPPGAGKSSLVNELTKLVRQSDELVGIISVDPTSPFTGGALLGDRLRMGSLFSDPNVFIRSMATRGASGGLSRKSIDVGLVLEYAGYNTIIFETVGVGQVELDIMNAVDTTVLVLVPESGDEIQMMKAGIIEIADIFVINKSDREGAGKLRRSIEQLLEMQSNNDGWKIPVINTCATTGDGVEELHKATLAHKQYLSDTGHLKEKHQDRSRRQVKRLVARNTMDLFWTEARLNILESKLGKIPPHELSRLILDYD